MNGINRVEPSEHELIPLSPEIEMSIRKRMATIPIFRTLGFGDVHLGRGSFESIVPRKSEYDGIFECFHGGLLMTIADSAAAIAVLTVCGSESRIATTDMNIRFLAPAHSEVKVRAQVIKAGKTLIPVSANLWDAQANLVAFAQVTYFKL
jgi:uncharacterized protein (TIGR00369 family)